MSNKTPPRPSAFHLLFILLAGFLIFSLLLDPDRSTEELSRNKFQTLEESGQIKKDMPLVLKDKKQLEGFYLAIGEKDSSQVPATVSKNANVKFTMAVDTTVDQDFLTRLRKEYPNFTLKSSPDFGWFWSLLPIFIILAIFLSFKKSVGGGGAGGILGSATKSKFNKINPDKIKVSFDDVAGIEEAKAEVLEIVDFLKNPARFQQLGAKIPKGALLVGRPGTGKTLLAKAIAKAANVPFFAGSGSGFVEMFVGVGASRVRDLFNEAKASAPCIIFIDEIDAVGGKRDNGFGGGNSEKEQTINELLSQMDGFESNPGVIVLAATNRPEILDEALKRPGRFDREIIVNLPSLKGREEILKIHTKNKPLLTKEDLENLTGVFKEVPVNLETLAKRTHNFSGANLENLANEAAIHAARRSSLKISMVDFEMAMDKLLMGLENKSLSFTKEQLKKTAIHEAGHTIINKLFKDDLDPLHKVSVTPRGRALGVTMTLPEGELLNYTKSKCEKMISMLMGGRLAEKIIYKEETTGASDDINKATQIARSMVYSWGMSEMGPLNYENDTHHYDAKNKFSEEIRAKADQTVQKIVIDNEKIAEELLTKNIKALEALAEALTEKETLDAQEVDDIIGTLLIS